MLERWFGFEIGLKYNSVFFEICYTVNCVIVTAVVVIDNYFIKLFVG